MFSSIMITYPGFDTRIILSLVENNLVRKLIPVLPRLRMQEPANLKEVKQRCNSPGKLIKSVSEKLKVLLTTPTSFKFALIRKR